MWRQQGLMLWEAPGQAAGQREGLGDPPRAGLQARRQDSFSLPGDQGRTQRTHQLPEPRGASGARGGEGTG